MSARPVAYVMEQTLGNVTHYLNLRNEGAVQHDGAPRWLPIAYRGGRLPWMVRGSLDARRALKPVLAEVDGVFIHTTTLAPLVADCFGSKPTVLSCDGTPLNKREMRQLYDLKPEQRWERHLKRALYRRVFARAAGFVGWSAWAKASFVDDYGCREEDVAVIPPGVDLARYTAGDRRHELPRLLFVGGDLVRKGGDLLLDVFRRRFRGRAELILVTRSAVADEPGVTVHRDVQPNSDMLRSLYATSDVFVLPTRADCFSLVALEALACGLPLVVTRVGGVAGLVQDGVTGHVVEVNDAARLGDALEALIADPAARRTMGERGRAEAERAYDVRTNARRLFEFVRSRC